MRANEKITGLGWSSGPSNQTIKSNTADPVIGDGTFRYTASPMKRTVMPATPRTNQFAQARDEVTDSALE